jgi:formylglycine-generating enzyme required for sulfatase activity/predicted Ser/Thr protein kinase
MENPTSNTQALPAGTRLEEFVVERLLGSGGFGITYLARDTRLDRQVVIKENLPAQFCFRDTHSLTVAPRHTHGEDADNFRWSLENFSNEAAMLASLDHPGIVRVHRSFEAFGTAYFVMPYLEGLTFDELVASRRDKGHVFSEEELRGFLFHVLGALGYLHDRGVYHRDLKPGNLFVTLEGMPVLIDFGSARQRLSERSMTVIESAGYTPFEQLQSRGNVGPWSDLYALAATLVKVITGEAPPKAMDRMRKDPYLPLAGRADLQPGFKSGFLHAIDRALAVDEEDRWQAAEEWLAELFAPTVQTAARPQSTVVPVNRSASVDPSAESGSAGPEPQAGEEREFDLVEGCKIRMCWIPPGEFLMGSSEGELGRREDETLHRVVLTRGFWMSKYPVTQSQWAEVMGNRPSQFGHPGVFERFFRNPQLSPSWENFPVETVTWFNVCDGFLKKVNSLVPLDWRYGLPTEAQWEYAARAGTSTALNSGKDLTSTEGVYRNLGEVAWYAENSGNRTHPVGQKRPNAWGLHDMQGNVLEWCQDWYGSYPSGVGIDPRGTGSGAYRVIRGGSWLSATINCRVAYRYYDYPTGADSIIGFRVVRSSVP